MPEDFLYEGKLELPKRFPPGAETWDFGKYRLIPNPISCRIEAFRGKEDILCPM